MKNKFKKPVIIASLTLICIVNFVNAQCSLVSGTSGVVQNAGGTVSVNYTCTVSGATIFYNLGTFIACGVSFPGIDAPWSNNTNVLGTATYTFSTPIYAIDVVIGYVGVTGQIQPETFTITTNGSIPSLTVDSGTCAAWTTAGNVITSPSVPGGINSIVRVSSFTPFTTLSILSGANSSSTGGSSYGLCSASVFTSLHEQDANPANISIYPNPNRGNFNVDIINMFTGQFHLEIYSSLGAKISEQLFFNSRETTGLDLTEFPKGIYFVKCFDNETTHTRKIVIE